MHEYHPGIKPITLARFADVIRKLHAHHLMDGVLNAHHIAVVACKRSLKPYILSQTKGDVVFNARPGALRPIVHHVN